MLPLGTLDRNPPPLFKQGPSALSQVVFFVALCIFLMVADARFRLLEPVRAVVATVVVPAQRALAMPVAAWAAAVDYMAGVTVARANESRALTRLNQQSVQALQASQMVEENTRLRELLNLRARLNVSATAAEIVYDAPDPFSRKVVIDRGLTHGVQRGAPVVNEMGVLGQVTRAYPLTSEVTLLTDREAAIPVLNSRTNQRGAAYGDPTSVAGGGGMELRFMANNADVQMGDLLTTSGVDGVYPAGLPVAKVVQVDRRADSSFAKVMLMPVAVTDGVRLAMVLAPVGGVLPPRPPPDPGPNKPGKPGVQGAATATSGVVATPEAASAAASAAKSAAKTASAPPPAPPASPASATSAVPGVRVLPGGLVTPAPMLEVTPMSSPNAASGATGAVGAGAGAGASSVPKTSVPAPIFPVPDDPASVPTPDR